MEVVINGIKYAPEMQYISGEYCKKCKSDAYKTVDSRVKDGIRYRRKECQWCGFRWTTAEYSLGE